jgi:hypothetical protein
VGVEIADRSTTNSLAPIAMDAQCGSAAPVGNYSADGLSADEPTLDARGPDSV